jgi:hypothetical protein
MLTTAISQRSSEWSSYNELPVSCQLYLHTCYGTKASLQAPTATPVQPKLDVLAQRPSHTLAAHVPTTTVAAVTIQVRRVDAAAATTIMPPCL